MPKQYKHGEELRKFWRESKRKYRANVKKRLAEEEQRKKWKKMSEEITSNNKRSQNMTDKQILETTKESREEINKIEEKKRLRYIVGLRPAHQPL